MMIRFVQVNIDPSGLEAPLRRAVGPLLAVHCLL